MAIHPDYPGLTVSIEVAGQELVEYNDEEAPADSNTIVRYIEVRSGAEFVVRYTFAQPFPTKKDVRVSCKMDGTSVGRPLISRKGLFRATGYTFSGVRAKEGPGWVQRAFRFSDMNIGMHKTRLLILVERMLMLV